jgi:hypothetical protein
MSVNIPSTHRKQTKAQPASATPVPASPPPCPQTTESADEATSDRLALYVWIAGFGILALVELFKLTQYVFR